MLLPLLPLLLLRYTPELQWVERSYRQASKHLHAADPTDVCVLMGAWGEMGFTPRDRLFLNQVCRGLQCAAVRFPAGLCG